MFDWASPMEQAERALTCADEMAIRASQYRQMGFPRVARWLNDQVKAARKWAAQQMAED